MGNRRDLRPWTPAEDSVLAERYPQCATPRRVDWEALQALLPGRTALAVKGRIGALGLRRRSKEPDWSESELAYLREVFWRKSLQAIARKLGRSPDGVKIKAARMGWRRRRSGTLTANRVAKVLRKDLQSVLRWIDRGWLRAHVIPTKRQPTILVAPTDLVTCLRERPQEWDSRRCPDLHIRLGLKPKRRDASPTERPLWLKEKLAADIALGRQGKPWKPEEEHQLAVLFARGLMYPAIARRLRRSVSSVEHRLCGLRRRGVNVFDLAKRFIPA